jgi:hypothetical protein
VTANRKRWAANITYDSKKHRLGTFDAKQEAALAYDKQARQCGEDKQLNAGYILVHDMCAAEPSSRIGLLRCECE